MNQKKPSEDQGSNRPTEDDVQREKLGPRGVPGGDDKAKMVPQQEKNIPKSIEPGHTA